MRGLSIGEKFIERDKLVQASQEKIGVGNDGSVRSDGSLAVLNSNFQTNFFVTFKDMYPVSLSALEFNATIDGSEYAVAQASFRYAVYDIQDTYGVRKTQLK